MRERLIPRLDRMTVLSSVVLLAGAACLTLRAQTTQPQQSPAGMTPVPSATAPGPEFFNGTWDYNADFSINAATGRPEQNPKAAGARRPTGGSTGGTGSSTSRPPGGGGSGGSGSGGSGGSGGTSGVGGGGFGAPGGYGGGGYGGGGYGGAGGGGGGLINPYEIAMTEQKDLLRDLLEVAEVLKIAVTNDTVTFVDDLDRTRAYPTSGKKQHYQLGAASYDAKVHWEGHQLIKEMEGARGFKMSETFFLSEDGKRMFMIVRVGEPPKDKDKDKVPPIVGFNRVYDRVGQ